MFTDRTLPLPAAIALTGALAAVLLVTACGSVESGSDGAASSPPPPGSTTPSPVRPIETTPTPIDPTDLPSPTGTGAEVTVRGTVAQGVEAGCLVLSGYQLVINDAELQQSLRPGTEVEVTGRPSPGMMTICQQGIPLVVTAVRPL
ncbi:MAG: hypothetical protein L0Y54_19025 [Sporichthyaceae bacterium]|nr:hypothetical protein [Sporichthyaceae bacterium]